MSSKGMRPEPGLVIQYAYLWAAEADKGLIIGRKDRPCVNLAVGPDDTVRVLPITTQDPGDDIPSIRLPKRTQERLGLKTTSWVLLTEYNMFRWRGYDVVDTPDRREAYGPLPAGLFDAVREGFIAADAAYRSRAVQR